MQLDPIQIGLATTVATVGVWFLTFVWMGVLKKPKPSENVLKGGVFVTSTVLAYAWMPVQLPVIGDGLFEFVSALLVSATAIFKLAQLAYDFIWQRIVEGLASFQPLAFLSTRR